MATGACVVPVAAQINGDVRWELLSHVDISDRHPIVPIDREAFDVLFQSARDDLTSARVRIDPDADGVEPFTYVDGSHDAARGPSDIWRARVPVLGMARVGYIIEVTDHPDTDYLTPDGIVGDASEVASQWVIDFDTLEHAPRGSTVTSDGVVFRVWAPNAAAASVRGHFNGWGQTPMMSMGDDFIVHVRDADAGDQYKYFFTGTPMGSVWNTDPYARRLVQSDGMNAEVVDRGSYTWQYPDFTPADRNRWVVYQLHVGTFSGRNDPFGPTPPIARYRDVTARVDHLRELGVNAVMLNPINEFPSTVSGGYNSITMHGWESSYGTPDELKEMVDTLHGAGIAVILDTVWNHMSSGSFTENFDGGQPYYDDPIVGTPWGPQMDMDRADVRRYFLDSVETVLGEFGMDGYRHDAIYELVSATQWAGGQQLVRDSMARIRSRYPDAHVIGEVYNNSAWNVSEGGIHLHGQYHEAFKNAIAEAISAASFGDPDMGRLAASLDGSGPFVDQSNVFNYFELHDEAWPLSGEGRTREVAQIDPVPPADSRWALGRTKLGNGVTLLAQGMPAILMGTEWAEDDGWEVSKIDWSHKITYAGVFAFYRDLIHLRRARPELFANAPISVYHVNDGANVLAFERFYPDGRSYVIVANFSNTDFPEYNVGVPRVDNWGVILNSEDAKYRGTGFGTMPGPVATTPGFHSGHGQYVSLELPAHGFIMLQHDPEYIVAADALDRDFDGDADAGDVLRFLADVEDGLPQGDVNGDLTTDFFDVILWLNRLDEGP